MVPLNYNTRSIWVRKATALSSVFGIALVVFVLASSLMLSRGIHKTMGSSGSTSNAIVLRKGAGAELTSGFDASYVNVVLAAPGAKKAADGQPLGSGEVVLVVALDRTGAPGQVANVSVRGVGPRSLELRKQVQLVAGRAAKPGTDEVIVGKAVRGQYVGLELGQRFELKKNRPATVVGIFEASGSSFESEIWADIDAVRTAFGREGLVSSVSVALDAPERAGAFKAAIEADKRLNLEVFREDQYFEKQADGTATMIGFLGTTVTFFLGVGAVIGAVITMNVAVSNRKKEIGTLRALGFSRFAVLSSFLAESLVLALVGAGIGALASLWMSTVKISLMNQNTWSRISFSFTPSVDLLVSAILVGAIMGIFGGFLPALRAARIAPIEAMRE